MSEAADCIYMFVIFIQNAFILLSKIHIIILTLGIPTGGRRRPLPDVFLRQLFAQKYKLFALTYS